MAPRPPPGAPEVPQTTIFDDFWGPFGAIFAYFFAFFNCGSEVIRDGPHELLLQGAGCRHSPRAGGEAAVSTAAVTSLSSGRNLDQKQLHKHLCKESAKILGSMQRLCEATCCNKSPKRGGLGEAHLD